MRGRRRSRTRKRAGDVVEAKLAQLLPEVLVVAGGAGAHGGGNDGLGRLEPRRSITSGGLNRSPERIE